MYFIIEIQKNAEGQYLHLVYTAEDIYNADHQYHLVLSYAAISDLPMHSVSMFTADGEPVKHEAYWHDITPSESAEE